MLSLERNKNLTVFLTMGKSSDYEINTMRNKNNLGLSQP